MAIFHTAILTNSGAGLTANSIVEGYQIEFVKMVVGSGIYEESEKGADALRERAELKQIRQEFGFSSVLATDENEIRLKALITNTDLEEGYRITEIGIIAKKVGDDEEILYSIAVADQADFLPSKASPVEINQEYYTKVSSTENITINVEMGAYALAEDMQSVLYPEFNTPEQSEEPESGENIFSILGKVKRAISDLISHIGNENNPHNVTKEQIGLGNVDNTADINKPVSTAQQQALENQYTQLTGYTDKAIADLIGGAPETLDTLKEVADAIAENESVVEALDAAIGKKADQAELDTHSSNTTVHITESERQKWNAATVTMTGASASAAGKVGLVPAPAAGTQSKVLTGGGIWSAIEDLVTAFTKATSRVNLASGETLKVSMGKIMKWFAEMKTVAFTGSYDDLTDKPSIPSPSSTTPKAPGTAAVGTETEYAKGDHVHPLPSKLSTARTIDGVNFDGSGAIMHYGTCSTAAATAAKVVACTGFTLVTGAVIRVKFTVTNTAASPTLNVNSTGEKAIYYRGAAISASYLAANRTYEFVYNGTQYELVGDINTDTNTTYSAATASAAGLMSAADKKAVDELADTYAKKSIYGDTSVSKGRKDGTTVGSGSFAFGYLVTASGTHSHAEGGGTIASSTYSHAEGFGGTASGNASHAEGRDVTASGTYSHAEGFSTKSANYASHASGKHSKDMTTGGSETTQVGDAFVIGNGTGSSALSNALRVTYTGYIYGTRAFTSSGADYAEFVEPWWDGNEEDEDRVGYFVTVKDGLLYKANEGDYIAGITSGNPSVIGNGDEDYYWKYERDEFNRIVMEDVPEMIQKEDEEGNPMFDKETGEPIVIETGKIIPNARMKLSDDYDPSMQESYVERKDRKEWDYVGMLGVLPVRDDGTCLVGSFCKCGQDGIATLAAEQGFNTYMVIERVAESIVKVILK